tara:strand:- start:1523 stop:1930 length:408 start_codon:yes stop_codon:yes gene_type:complete
MKINCCIVIASYYPNISKNLLIGATKVLKSNGIKKFKIIQVHGVYEIPVVIAKNIKKYNAFISLGCVIKGKTPHFNFISKSTINAIMNLSITHKKPIGNGIITCLNKQQALIRSDFSKKNKGGEAARAMLSVLKN